MTTISPLFEAASDLLKDKVILITGATGGFGDPVSMALARHGASVILLAKNLRKVEALYDRIVEAGYAQPAIYPMNLEGATEPDYADLYENINKEFGRIDGLIHCAAFFGAPTVFEQSDSVTWHQVHQVNLHAPYLLTRACLPLLTKSNRASVVFMVDDKEGAYWDAYQVSKQGLTAMAGLLANEYDGGHIRFNCLNPGKTRTALHLRAYPAADNNDKLPTAADHIDKFLYLMSDQLDENGEMFS
ncbi:MAG: NAD(P)-dependent dehydrogenase (short-subunit alcohol dehydrogenase family) [Planctomycetota bacterium]|jgi:NAD(P)-dependent dehydrogenase (short-subunit alcohol dehydrogenase family)